MLRENVIRGKSSSMEAGQEDVMWMRMVAIKMVGFWIDFKGKAKRVCGQIGVSWEKRGVRMTPRFLV